LKVFDQQDRYQREAAVFRRLAERDISRVAGAAVPIAVTLEDELRCIEMTIVSPPFVLDFASATLDVRVEFPREALEEWAATKREEFGPDWPRVRLIIAGLAGHGIHLQDVHRGNIRLGEDGAEVDERS